jgi:DNA-binding winged helix-turn-helix (wHTH) protein
MTPSESLIALRIGDWHVDPVLKQLSRGDEVVRVDPRNMRVLLLLASRPGEVVSQSEIERIVWSGAVVTPNSVYQSIAQLRRALGEDKSSRRYIETVSRKGYRLIVPVHPDSGTPGSVDRVPELVRAPTSRRTLAGIAGIAAVVVAGVVAFVLITRDEPASSTANTAQVARVAEQVAGATPHQGASYYRRSIERLLAVLDSQSASVGKDDVSLVPTLLALANYYPLVSEPLKCEQVARRGIAILVAHGQEKSPEGVELHATLAEALADTERYAEAERHLKRAYEYAREIHGDLQYPTISAIDQLALLRIAQGRSAEAVIEARRAVANYEKMPDASNTRAGYLRSTVMWALIEQGRYAEAIDEGNIALQAITPQDAPSPYLVAYANHFLGEALVKAGRYREAEAPIRRELALLRTIPHCEMDSARAESALAEALMRQGQLQEAARLLASATLTLEIGDGWRERKARRETAARLVQLRGLESQRTAAAGTTARR